MNKLFLICLFMLMSTISWAKDKVEMADVMRRDGKIYTVVAVCLTILIGLFIYVFLIDRKINKLEKEQQQ